MTVNHFVVFWWSLYKWTYLIVSVQQNFQSPNGRTLMELAEQEMIHISATLCLIIKPNCLVARKMQCTRVHCTISCWICFACPVKLLLAAMSCFCRWCDKCMRFWHLHLQCWQRRQHCDSSSVSCWTTWVTPMADYGMPRQHVRASIQYNFFLKKEEKNCRKHLWREAGDWLETSKVHLFCWFA